MKYAYICPTHGLIEVDVPADSFVCLEDNCGEVARRSWSVTIKAGAGPVDRYYDPQVGAVVGSQRESDELLKAGQDRQERELNMPVKLTKVDARDTEGLAELHNMPVEVREADREWTARAHYDEAAKANKTSKVKVEDG